LLGVDAEDDHRHRIVLPFADIATELLVGPVYFRLMFGGELSLAFANRVVDNVLHGYGVPGRESATPKRSVRTRKAKRR